MDRQTFENLKEIIGLAKQATIPTEKTFRQVDDWMKEVEKEIDDLPNERELLRAV